MLKARVFVAASLALVGLTGVAAAETSAALIVDTTGAQSAPAAYTEVQPGTTIALGASGTLKFVHYQTCKEIEVAGGTVTVNAGDFKLEGGKVVSEAAQPCPQQVKMAQTTAVAGGLVMRGVMKMTEVSDRPSLVIVGANAASISSVAFLEDSKKIAGLPVSQNRVIWASATTALKPGANYKLVLEANGKSQMEMPIRVVNSTKAGVVVVRVD